MTNDSSSNDARRTGVNLTDDEILGLAGTWLSKGTIEQLAKLDAGMDVDMALVMQDAVGENVLAQLAERDRREVLVLVARRTTSDELLAKLAGSRHGDVVRAVLVNTNTRRDTLLEILKGSLRDGNIELLTLGMVALELGVDDIGRLMDVSGREMLDKLRGHGEGFMGKAKGDVLEALKSSASALHRVGAMDSSTLHDFNAAIREQANVWDGLGHFFSAAVKGKSRNEGAKKAAGEAGKNENGTKASGAKEAGSKEDGRV